MSILARTKRKRIRNFEKRKDYNKGLDREIGNWEIIDVHLIPDTIKENDEFDFWCHNHKDLYLLKIRKNKKDRFFIAKSKGRHQVMYLVAEYDFKDLTNLVIEEVIAEYEERGIPKYRVQKMKQEL